MRPVLLFGIALLSATRVATAQQSDISPHGKLRAGLDCAACHTAEGWKPMREDAQFNHARQANFALDGSHSRLGCKSCHTDGRFDRPRASARDCAACHVDVHQGRLARDCTTCHDTRSFALRAGADPHTRTNFPLTGIHAKMPCEGCHRGESAGRFTAMEARCVNCHQTDFQAARSPVHDPATFPQECNQCHNSGGWHGARFNHAASAPNFPLSGVHASLSCTSCHAPPGNTVIFSGVLGPNDCLSCHRADYDRAHAATGFPVTCMMCHPQTSWRGARVDHDAEFPIYSGKHRGKWQGCADCHTSPANFAVFTCLTCHERTKTDAQHRERSGYVYDSVRCLACHPRGDS